MKLSVEERIKRANNIRQEKENKHRENIELYRVGNEFRIQKVLTFLFVSYVLISLLPVYPNIFKKVERVIFNSYYIAPKFGPVIVMSTDAGNDYKINGKEMGERAFHNGDTIIAVKNVLYKTRKLYHKNYKVYYSANYSNALLILLIITGIMLILLLLFKDYKLRFFYSILTFIAYGLVCVFIIS